MRKSWICKFLLANSFKAPDKFLIFISKLPISSQNPMFDHLLESSHRDDSNKWSNIGFGKEITQVESIEVNFCALSGVLNLHLLIQIKVLDSSSTTTEVKSTLWGKIYDI